jgi:hypothetical protein
MEDEAAHPTLKKSSQKANLRHQPAARKISHSHLDLHENEDGLDDVIREEDYEGESYNHHMGNHDYSSSDQLGENAHSRILTSDLELSIGVLRKDEERNRVKEVTVKGEVKYRSPDGTVKFGS